MNAQQIKLLYDAGFDVKQTGAKFFLSIVKEVQVILELIEDTSKNIPDYLPKKIEDIEGFMDRLYLEEYKFYYECGKTKYFNELNKFFDSRKTSSENDKVFKEIFGDSKDINSMVINFAKYSNHHKEEFNNSEKKFTKKTKKQ